MHTHESAAPASRENVDPRVETLTRAYNLMQIQLAEESGMDITDWIEAYSAVFRNHVDVHERDAPEVVATKKAIERACVAGDTSEAVRLVRTLFSFPLRAAD